jgi:hypothetical protein
LPATGGFDAANRPPERHAVGVWLLVAINAVLEKCGMRRVPGKVRLLYRIARPCLNAH